MFSIAEQHESQRIFTSDYFIQDVRGNYWTNIENRWYDKKIEAYTRGDLVAPILTIASDNT